MNNTMDAFWGNLGALAEPAESLSNCGCALGSTSALASLDATAAMAKVIAQYAALSSQGEILRQMMAAGAQIPCNVWSAYARARQDYLTKSQSVFDQLTARDITVEQVIYTNGKPKVDPTNPSKVFTLRISMPLRPPAFVGINDQCPTVPVMSGTNFQGDMGWEPTAMQLASAPGSILAAQSGVSGSVLTLLANGNPMGVAGYGTYKTIKPIPISMPEYDLGASQELATYTACFQSALKAGIVTSTAAAQCTNPQTATNIVNPMTTAVKAVSKFTLWHWLGLGAGAVLLLGIIRRLRTEPTPPESTMAPVAGLGRARRVRVRDARYSDPTDPILIGDLYLHPRRKRRGR